MSPEEQTDKTADFCPERDNCQAYAAKLMNYKAKRSVARTGTHENMSIKELSKIGDDVTDAKADLALCDTKACEFRRATFARDSFSYKNPMRQRCETHEGLTNEYYRTHSTLIRESVSDDEFNVKHGKVKDAVQQMKGLIAQIEQHEQDCDFCKEQIQIEEKREEQLKGG
jgi:hypothetical protein